MISVRHTTLPDGLSVLALREPGGDLTLYVSNAIEPDRQREAVKAALGASRRAGWRGALLPIPAAAVLTGSHTWLGAIGKTLRVHAGLAAAGTALAAATAVTLVAVVPHHAGRPAAGGAPPASSQPGAPGTPSSHPGATGRSRPQNHPPRGRPGAVPGGSTGGGPGRSSTTGAPPSHRRTSAPSGGPTSTPTSHPSPTPTTTKPAPPPTSTPAPTPSPTPKRSSGGTCVVILGIKVCLLTKPAAPGGSPVQARSLAITAGV